MYYIHLSAIANCHYFKIKLAIVYFQDHSAWPRFKFDVSGGKFVAGPVDKVFGPVPADTQYFIRPAAFVQECEDR